MTRYISCSPQKREKQPGFLRLPHHFEELISSHQTENNSEVRWGSLETWGNQGFPAATVLRSSSEELFHISSSSCDFSGSSLWTGNNWEVRLSLQLLSGEIGNMSSLNCLQISSHVRLTAALLVGSCLLLFPAQALLLHQWRIWGWGRWVGRGASAWIGSQGLFSQLIPSQSQGVMACSSPVT